jgi:polysaccharide export outer membrane protein
MSSTRKKGTPMRSLVLLLFALAALAPQAADAQEASPSPVGISEYQLGPGDLLSVRVAGLREFDLSLRVSNSGRIHVPYVGVMLVAGMTTFELERDVARLIKENELVNEPSVRIHVEQFRARPVYVVGEVNSPGQFIITREMYLLDLISKAGGLLGTADDKGFLYRRYKGRPRVQSRIIDPSVSETVAAEQSPDAGAEGPEPGETIEDVVTFDFEELRSGRRPELNVRLQGGDVVYVPRRTPQNIFIVGDVTTPGVYGLPRRGEVTASQALIYAGGPLPTAKTGSAFIMRHDEASGRRLIEFDFRRILDGKDPDVTIRPNDILFVPHSNMRTIGVGMLALVPRLIQQFTIF